MTVVGLSPYVVHQCFVFLAFELLPVVLFVRCILEFGHWRSERSCLLLVAAAKESTQSSQQPPTNLTAPFVLALLFHHLYPFLPTSTIALSPPSPSHIPKCLPPSSLCSSHKATPWPWRPWTHCLSYDVRLVTSFYLTLSLSVFVSIFVSRFVFCHLFTLLKKKTAQKRRYQGDKGERKSLWGADMTAIIVAWWPIITSFSPFMFPCSRQDFKVLAKCCLSNDSLQWVFLFITKASSTQSQKCQFSAADFSPRLLATTCCKWLSKSV